MEYQNITNLLGYILKEYQNLLLKNGYKFLINLAMLMTDTNQTNKI